ncbi:MAG: DNA adenine methylase [Lentisphaerae bacterium]|nr:DNA adenine methylase [Lentisphaerota bacterium]
MNGKPKDKPSGHQRPPRRRRLHPDASQIRELQDRRLDASVERWRQHEGASVAAMCEQGRIAWEQTQEYADQEEGLHRRKSGGAKNDWRERYGRALIARFARRVNCDSGTVWNRIYLFLALQSCTYDSRLSPSHYWTLQRLVSEGRLTTAQRAKLLGAAVKDETAWSLRRLQKQAAQAAKPANRRGPAYNAAKELNRIASRTLNDALGLLRRVRQCGAAEAVIAGDRYRTAAELLRELAAVMDGLGTEGANAVVARQPAVVNIRPVRGMDHASHTGSKRALVEWTLANIFDALPRERIATACDLFAGRGHVGHGLKQQGLAVTANDVRRMPAEWCRWVVESNDPRHPPLTERDLALLLGPAPVGASVPDFVERHFHFSHAGEIEQITLEHTRVVQRYLANLERLDPPKRRFATALLAVVLNERLPVANGNQHAPDRLEFDLPEDLRLSLHEANSCIVEGASGCRSTSDPAAAHLEANSYDLVYIDPPHPEERRGLFVHPLCESVMAGRVVSPKYIRDSRDALDILIKRLDSAAPYWAWAHDPSGGVSISELGAMIAPHRATHVVRMPISTAVGARAQCESGPGRTEWLILCRPYHAAVVSGGIVSRRREASYGSQGARVVWQKPDGYGRQGRPAVPGKVRITVACIGNESVITCLDGIGGACREVLNAVTRPVAWGHAEHEGQIAEALR